ncbi:RNA polymerase sigma factor [Chryseobacterium pennae]|uniref:RNA polymerase sigma factor n=1 Tax=Chryseobacterium pennae TaxID=2258962 RepID=UPI0014031A0F|nr:RNA polymerase sigma factor [Chryseobacterium pennae]
MIVKTNDWQKIYSTHSPKLLGICRRYIQDLHTAEDILQDSFIAAIQNIHQLKDEKMLFAWLKKIVVNNALQYLRKSNKETFITDELPETFDASLAMSNTDEKVNILAYDFTQEELLSSIDSLPNHHKSVFNLYFIENYSHAEIANQLGITINTSKSHLLRAKKAVQSHLLKTIQPATPKNRKKLTQLLVFIGLGNLLWAQTFRSKFSDFSLSTSRILRIPEDVTPTPYPIPVSSRLTKRMGTVTGGGTLLILIIVCVIIYRPSRSIFFSNSIHSGNSETIENGIQPKTETESLQNSISTINRYDVQENKQTTPEIEKTEIPEVTAGNIKAKGHQITTKDTAKEDSPRKVIVVKKIIQRDTIYVER